MRIAIRTGKLYDGTDAAPRDNVTLLVEDGRIAAIAGDDDPVEADARTRRRASCRG